MGRHGLGPWARAAMVSVLGGRWGTLGLATGLPGPLVGGVSSPHSLEESWTHVDWESSWEELSSPIPRMCLPSPPSLSLSCGSPKGCVWARSNPPLHAVVLGEFRIRSKTDLLLQSRLDRRDRKKSLFTVCVWVLGGATLVAPVLSYWRRGVEIYTTLRSATSASSSTPVQGRNPHDWSTRVRHRSPVIVTVLLPDRSWAIRGCVGNIFFVICTKPQQWYQSLIYA
jgi:hypothetical protein